MVVRYRGGRWWHIARPPGHTERSPPRFRRPHLRATAGRRKLLTALVAERQHALVRIEIVRLSEYPGTLGDPLRNPTALHSSALLGRGKVDIGHLLKLAAADEDDA